MTGRRFMGVLALLAATTLLAAPARAQSDREESILINPPPMVFLLVDTSVSMEYTTVAGTTPVCGAPGVSPDKNRWLMVLEALTGTFVEPSCVEDLRIDTSREDFGQSPPVPHTAWSHASQGDDGLLDLLSDELAFGLMTLDSSLDPDTGAGGGWSYYFGTPDGASAGSYLDLGVRNASAPRGGLAHPCVEPDEACLDTRALEIQERLKAAIPYGAAPLGAAISDLSEYLSNEPVAQPSDAGNPGGDPFATCRERALVLIANGGPDFDGQYGYGHAAVEAQELLTNHGVRTYVVAFLLDDPHVDLPILSEIAYYGGTGAAYVANSAAELRGVLGSILGSLSTEVWALSEPVITDATRSADTRQIRLYAGTATLPSSTIDRQGVLEQELWACDESCNEEPTSVPLGEEENGLGLCEILDLGAVLDAHTPSLRELYTAEGKPTGAGSVALRQLRAGAGFVSADDMEIPDLGRDYPKVAMWSLYGNLLHLPGTRVGEDLTTGVVNPALTDAELRETYAEELIELVRGGPTCRRQGAMLGAIERGGPVLQTAPYRMGGVPPSYQAYALDHADRPTMAYVSTHEGLVHAFRIDRDPSLSSADYGKELWAFMPGFALRRLHELDDSYAVLLDGKMSLAEILPRRTDGNADPATEAASWRSILVAAGGEDNRALFALDVTNPESWSADKFLWEITHEGRCVGAGGTCRAGASSADSDFSKLGYQSPRPLIGRMYVNEGESPVETGVVVIAGGRDPADAGLGRVLYVVDVATGERIVEFSEEAGNVDGGDGGASLDAYPLTGTPVGYSVSLGGFLSRIFVGDAGGRIWRVDIDSPDPTSWRLRLFDDAYSPRPEHWIHRQPVLEPPALALSANAGRLALLYTTGSAESELGAEKKYRMRSIVEEFDGSAIVATLNWELEFENGELPIGRPVIFDKVAYFTTYVQDADLCVAGNARLWGVDYMLKDGSTQRPVARLDADGDPLTYEAAVEWVAYSDAVPLGVRVVREPSCDLAGADLFDSLPGSFFDDPNAGAPGGSSPGLGGMRLLVQTRGAAGATPQVTPPTGAAGPDGSQLGRIARSLPVPGAQVIVESWATVFE